MVEVFDGFCGVVFIGDFDVYYLVWLDVGNIFDGYVFCVGDVVVLLVFIFFEGEWDDVYFNKVGMVNVFEGLGDDGLNVK